MQPRNADVLSMRSGRVPSDVARNLVPRAHVPFGQHQDTDQKARGLWERDCVARVMHCAPPCLRAWSAL